MSGPHRKRRIAADEAHSWARNLRLANPYGKMVLTALTLYVNGDGVCFVGIEALAYDIELSADTVRKRLAWLEGIGAIVRLPQWIDANGKRNGEAIGRRTSDEIRLLIEADPGQIEARAKGIDALLSDDDDGAASPGPQQGSDPGCQQGLNPAPGSVSPVLALGRPSDSREGLMSEPEPESFPPTPLPGGGVDPKLDQREESTPTEPVPWPHEASWREFESAWVEPILHQTLCRQIWGSFGDDERATAILVAKGYVAWRRSQKKPPNACNAQKILREREAWAKFSQMAPREPQKPKPTVTVDYNTPEFCAFVLMRAIARRPAFLVATRCVMVPAPVPAGAEALAQLVNWKDGLSWEVDQSTWTLAERDSIRLTAWCERAAEWLGFWPEIHRYWLDEAGNIVPTAGEAYVAPGKLIPRARDGLMLPPLEFPPPKGTGNAKIKPESG